jgi:glycosyltransferase involved in cell wall biosynthesis
MEVLTMAELHGDIEISAVIPVGARHADAAALYRDYKVAFEGLRRTYELIFVLDGRYPEVSVALEDLQRQSEPLVVVSLTRAFGESTALMAGFERARGRIIVTLPGYYQIESSEIPKLIDALTAADLAVGRRWPRTGSRFEALRRASFHRALGWVTRLHFSDLGCGARAMKRRVIEEIFLYGDQHRFFAILAHRQGFRVSEVTVRQSPHDRFEGHYRLREYVHRMLDILTVLFLVRFTKKPLRFFGMIGLALAGIGVLVLLYLIVARLGFGQPLADRPALLLTSLLVVLGLQLFAIGLLGELIIFTHARDIKDYQVERVIQFHNEAAQTTSTDAAQEHIAAP